MRVALLAALLAGSTSTFATGEVLTPEQQRRLESKLTLLVHMLERSPAAQRIRLSPSDSDARQVLDSVVSRRQQAEAAMQAGRAADAESLIDDALAGFQEAARLAVDPGRQARVEEARFDTMRRQAGSFLDAFQRIAEEKGESASRYVDLDDLALQLDRADTLAGNGVYPAANELLRVATGKLEKALSDIRHQETLVQLLVFDTPMDEYIYERERNLSHAMLVRLVAGESDLPASSINFIDALIQRNRSLRETAEQHVSQQQVEQAIAVLEQGTAELEKALRMVGIRF